MSNLEIHNDDPKLGGSKGHLMWTTARLDRLSGLLVAQTRTQSVTQLGGFHGCVLVSLLDNNGAIIRSSEPHSYGVDGRLIGTSDRSDGWTHQFDPAEANAAVRLGLLHTWDPDWATPFKKIGQLFMQLLILFGQNSGGTDTTTEEEPESWSEDGEPWELLNKRLLHNVRGRQGGKISVMRTQLNQ